MLKRIEVLLYSYFGVMIAMAIHSEIKKLTPEKTLTFATIPSLLFIFVGATWILDLPIWGGILLVIVAYIPLHFLITGKSIFKKNNEQKK